MGDECAFLWQQERKMIKKINIPIMHQQFGTSSEITEPEKTNLVIEAIAAVK